MIQTQQKVDDYNNEFKIAARLKNIEIYKKLTRKKSLYKNRHYVTLCNYQDPYDKNSEINQMINSGMIEESQFIGIDWDEDIIKQNKIWHKKAKWYAGDWLDVIESIYDFNPELIYLDTTSFADGRIACRMIGRTMSHCKQGTVLLANVMLNDPRSRRQFDPKNMLEKLIKQDLPRLEAPKWAKNIRSKKIITKSFVYSKTKKTYMCTLIFYKKYS